MTKLSKTDLKIIVKECLIEILAEGLAQGSRPQVPVSKKRQLREVLNHSKKQGRSEKSLKNNRLSYLDKIRFDGSQNSNQDNKVDVRAKNLASSITSDPVLNEILIDTAKSTMREQISADNSRGYSNISRPADKAASIVSNVEPNELFGHEVASKWATLAFGK